MSEQPQPRGTPREESPFCWQSKAGLRVITSDPIGGNKAHTLLTYLALTWRASDVQSDTFQVTKGFLGDLIGLGERSLTEALLALERLGLVKVAREKVPGTKANAVNTYTLISCARRTTSRTQRTTSRTGSRPSRARNEITPVRGEKKEKEKTALIALRPSADAGAGAGAEENKQPSFIASWTPPEPPQS